MTAQLERLIADTKQIDAYITKVQHRGDTNRVEKLSKKKNFLLEAIAELKGNRVGSY
jgi:hypothetical protein